LFFAQNTFALAKALKRYFSLYRLSRSFSKFISALLELQRCPTLKRAHLLTIMNFKLTSFYFINASLYFLTGRKRKVALKDLSDNKSF